MENTGNIGMNINGGSYRSLNYAERKFPQQHAIRGPHVVSAIVIYVAQLKLQPVSLIFRATSQKN